MNPIGAIYGILTPHERRQILLLIPLLAGSAVLEVAGVVSVVPFLAVVADPQAVEQSEMLRRLFATGWFADPRELLIALGVMMFVFILGGNALTALTKWALLRFSWMRNHTIALRLLWGYLNRPYVFFLERHSADLGKNLVSEVQQVVTGTIVPALQALSRTVAALGVLALLVYVDPVLALITATALGGSYGLLFIFIRRRHRRLGHLRLAANKGRFEAASEIFGGIKEIKLLGREREMVRRFSTASHTYADTTAKHAIMGQLPRFALEAVAFGGIVLMVLYLLRSTQDFPEIVPLLGLYAFAGYRLMPSLQQVFLGLTHVRFNQATLEHLVEELPPVDAATGAGLAGRPPLRIERSIRLRDVTFRFPTARGPLFRGLNLEVAARRTTAFVGETGSGKSTLVDLILGLLRPDEGTVEIDGVPLTQANLRRWQRNLGYVPQSIFLTNDSVKHNIALGLADGDIDMEAVKRAARAAAIHHFVQDELPHGYDTVVGERGARLSGGQRQRIGIARALYHDPEVLVLDEATSSLDSVTEESVLKAVAELGSRKTVLMIAHRLSTVEGCDAIHLLSKGRIIATGTHTELMASSAPFRALSNAELP